MAQAQVPVCYEARLWWRPPDPTAGYLPEGPRWFRWRQQEWLAWVNIQTGPEARRGQLYVSPCEWDRSPQPLCIDCPGRPGFVLPTSHDGLLCLGCDKGIYYYDLNGSRWSRPAATIPDTQPRTIINDAEATPDGAAIVFGTKDVAFREPLGHLYLFTPADGQISILADRQTCSNGKVIQPAGDGQWVLLDIDSPTRTVRRYHLDVARRQVTELGIAVDLRGEAVFPDGMVAADAETVIIALYDLRASAYGRAVAVHVPTGKIVAEWRTPRSPRVTCPALVPSGGVGGRVALVLTTADEGMLPELRQACPEAGCLFVADTPWDSCPPQATVRLPGFPSSLFDEREGG